MRAASFVLVGGQSSRMGRDKALLPTPRGVLLSEIAEKATAVTGAVILVGCPERYARLGFECLPDLHPGHGPLAGIETALKAGRAEYNLILACDMPNIGITHLEALLLESVKSGSQCVVTRDARGRVHPLCAVYRGACLAAVQEALRHNTLKLMDLIRDLNSSILDYPGNLQNVNTPEEWMAAQASIA